MTDRKRVLVACEFSGIVREAFREKGFEAVSCDIRETEQEGQHIQGDALTAARIYDWDAVIAHPPCTYLCNSGVRWLHENEGRERKMEVAAHFFKQFLELDVPHIAVENPVMHKYAKEIIGRGQDFSIQPYQFGHPKSKRTCFWTKNLPDLEPTNVLEKKGDTWENQTPSGQNKLGPSDDRGKKRSEFFTGVAEAMADQWGSTIKGGIDQ